ncbi:NUDIX domain-containing protein [Streptomyces actuosus]|nr:NUDIX domain-containing protein [Streptomyces actuosus]
MPGEKRRSQHRFSVPGDWLCDDHAWELPSGVIEVDTPEGGVSREALEESGIQVEVDELTDVAKNPPRGVVVLVFPCKPSEPDSWQRPARIF